MLAKISASDLLPYSLDSGLRVAGAAEANRYRLLVAHASWDNASCGGSRPPRPWRRDDRASHRIEERGGGRQQGGRIRDVDHA